MGCGTSSTQHRRDTHRYHGVVYPEMSLGLRSLHTPRDTPVAAKGDWFPERDSTNERYRAVGHKKHRADSAAPNPTSREALSTVAKKKGKPNVTFSSSKIVEFTRGLNTALHKKYRLPEVDELSKLPAWSNYNGSSGSGATMSSLGLTTSSITSDANNNSSSSRPKTSPPTPPVRVVLGPRRRLRHYNLESLQGLPRRVQVTLLLPDEQLMAVCEAGSSTPSVYSLSLRTVVGRLAGHTAEVVGGDCSPSGLMFATASKDNTVIIWDALTRRMRATLVHPKGVVTCRFSPNGAELTTACQDGVCRVFHAQDGSEILSYSGQKGQVLCLAYTTDSRFCLSGGTGQQVCGWSAARSDVVVFSGHKGVITALDAQELPGDRQCVLSMDERVAYLWEVNSLVVLAGIDVASASCGCVRTALRPYWTAAALSPSAKGGHLLLATSNKTFHVYYFDHLAQEKPKDSSAPPSRKTSVRSLRERCASAEHVAADDSSATCEELLWLSMSAPVRTISCGDVRTACLGDQNGNLFRLSLE